MDHIFRRANGIEKHVLLLVLFFVTGWFFISVILQTTLTTYSDYTIPPQQPFPTPFSPKPFPTINISPVIVKPNIPVAPVKLPQIATSIPKKIIPQPTCHLVKQTPRICAPHFMIIGAMHSRASLVASAIESVHNARVLRNTNFFSEDSIWLSRGPNAYWAYYRDWTTTVNGELCESYFTDFSSNTASRMYALMPHTKIIVVLPDPITRFERHALATGSYPNQIWLTLGQGEAKAATGCMRKDGYDSTCLMRLEMQYTGFILNGMYSMLLLPYQRRYGTQNIMVIQETRLVENYAVVIKEVYDFVGIDAVVPNNAPSIANTTYDPNAVLSEIYRKELHQFYSTL